MNSIINTSAYYHLWFIYALFGVYLSIPIIRIFIQNADKNTFYYFVLLWFFMESVMSLIEKTTGLERQVDFIIFTGFICYFVLGYVFREKW
ncbi:acyltransferase family protein [Candidatus Neomarinimicrobiota bacterium]